MKVIFFMFNMYIKGERKVRVFLFIYRLMGDFMIDCSFFMRVICLDLRCRRSVLFLKIFVIVSFFLILLFDLSCKEIFLVRCILLK